MNVKRYARGPVFWVVIVVVLVIAFSNLWGGGGSYKSVQTGQVVGAIDAGNITNAVVHDKEQIVQVTLKTRPRTAPPRSRRRTRPTRLPRSRPSCRSWSTPASSTRSRATPRR